MGRNFLSHLSVIKSSLRDRHRVLSLYSFCILCLLFFAVYPRASSGQEISEKPPEIISPEAETPLPVPLPAEEALPLPPQEGTVTIPIEAAEPPRGLFTRINEEDRKSVEYRGYLKS